VRLLPQPTEDGALPWRTPALTFLMFCVPLGLATWGLNALLRGTGQQLGGEVAPMVVTICATWAWFMKAPRHRVVATAAAMGFSIAAGGFVHSGGSQLAIFIRATLVAVAGAYAFALITHLPVDTPPED
jgi:hypothetical protein